MALHKNAGVCEECYVAEETGQAPPHVAGHCWTAAELLASPPRTPEPEPEAGR